MIITINMNDILIASKKIKLVGASNFKMTLIPKNEKFGGKNLLKISASNGTYHLETSIICCADDDITVEKEYAVPAVFSDVIHTLTTVGESEEVIFEIMDTSMRIKRGPAVVPISLMEVDKVTIMKPSDPKGQECFVATIPTEEMIKALHKGAIAAEEAGGKVSSYFNDSIIFLPIKESRIEIFSCNTSGNLASGCHLPVNIENQEIFDKKVAMNKCYSLSAGFVRKIVDMFGEKSKWFFFENQVVISSNMDIYILSVKNFTLNITSIRQMLFTIPDRFFEIRVKKKDINSAISIATLNQFNDDGKKTVIFHITNNSLKVTSVDGSNIMLLDAEKAIGEIRLGISVQLLKRALLSCSDDTICICGTEATKPIYFLDSYAQGAVLVLPVIIEEEDVKKSNDEMNNLNSKDNQKETESDA